MEIKLLPFQDSYLFSNKKFPCLCAGIGTGKTFMFLLKIWNYCKDYPGTTALIVRKEFTDLKDSTIRDFEKYFSVVVGSDKDFLFKNGSKIMFRHAAEIEVLKNINLGIAGIEQAEEFNDDTQFQFIRDRLRQNNGAEIRPLCVIANANGHNWIYKLWFNNPPNEEYDGVKANTFENEVNLPPDFIADLRRMEVEAPNHYRQYVMNSFEETEQDDFVFTFQELEEARKRDYAKREGYGLRLAGFDIARYGNDKCAVVCLQQMGALIWKICHSDQWEKKDLSYTTGRILSIVSELKADGKIIDEDGMGAGPLDIINANIPSENKYKGFRNPVISYQDDRFYGNVRTKFAFLLKDMVLKGHIALNEDVCQELATLKFKYMTDGRRILVSKEEMRKEGIKSPNLADALIMAVSLIGQVRQTQERQYASMSQYSKEADLFQLGGIR